MGIISYMMSHRKSTQSIDAKVLYRIRGKGRGSVHVPGDFLDFGSREAVDLVLHRLVQKGVPPGSASVKLSDQRVICFPAPRRGLPGVCGSGSHR